MKINEGQDEIDNGAATGRATPMREAVPPGEMKVG